MEKTAEGEEFEDEFLLSAKHSNRSAVLVDKGYQDADGFLRCATPDEKPRQVVLSKKSLGFNEKHLADGIHSENYFGRMGQLC